ncbi:MAG: hypothetical protein R6U44_12205 [Archaeoglobaceae archaeon]
MKKKDIMKLALLIQLLTLMVMPSVIADSPPNLPMFIHGEVIDTDNSEKAPSNAVVLIETDEGDTLTEEIDQNGYYGEPSSERLVVPECNSYEISVSVDGKEIDLGSHSWSSGDIGRLDLEYSAENQEGNIEEVSTTSSSDSQDGGDKAQEVQETQEQKVDQQSGTPATSKNDVQVGDEGIKSGDPSANAIQEDQAQDQQQVWKQGTFVVLIAASALVLIALAIYMRQK